MRSGFFQISSNKFPNIIKIIHSNINHSEAKPDFNTKLSSPGLLHDRVHLYESFRMSPRSTSEDENSLWYDVGPHHYERALQPTAGRIIIYHTNRHNCTSVLKHSTIRARLYAMCVSLANLHARLDCAAPRMLSRCQWISRSWQAPKTPRGSRNLHPHLQVPIR